MVVVIKLVRVASTVRASDSSSAEAFLSTSRPAARNPNNNGDSVEPGCFPSAVGANVTNGNNPETGDWASGFVTAVILASHLLLQTRGGKRRRRDIDRRTGRLLDLRCRDPSAGAMSTDWRLCSELLGPRLGHRYLRRVRRRLGRRRRTEHKTFCLDGSVASSADRRRRSFSSDFRTGAARASST